MEGTLSVQPQSNPVKGFEEYFLNLNVQNNTRNPWFIGKFTICISNINCIAEKRQESYYAYERLMLYANTFYFESI